MKYFFDLGNRYAAQSSWKDFALTKICVFSMGLAIGTQVPKRYKKAVIGTAACAFAATYIPLMMKMFKIATEKE